jgi:gamma-glutamylcyclotransferase (GGCT)/AIG2-like uncharacterized protein YtfP
VKPLFVYGTLLDEAQLRRVTGRAFPRRPARLAGQRREWPHGDHPYLVEDATGVVDGDLVDGLDHTALAALDAYEDAPALYERIDAVVTCDGVAVACWLYRRARRPPD